MTDINIRTQQVTNYNFDYSVKGNTVEQKAESFPSFFIVNSLLKVKALNIHTFTQSHRNVTPPPSTEVFVRFQQLT